LDQTEPKPRGRAALLLNFIPPYRAPLFRLLASELEELRIFVSTPMEPNRSWERDWRDLDVELLPSLTLPLFARHPHGFREPVFLHLPYTVVFRLWRARPDLVISGQLGAASALAALYRALRPGCRLVLWLTLSEVSEVGRGPIRRALRRWLLGRADAVMVNGESGARYVRGFGVPEQRIHRIQQAVAGKAFAAEPHRQGPAARRLLFVGSPEPRKGLRPFLASLRRWAGANPTRSLELWVAGTAEEFLGTGAPGLPPNLAVRWLGALPYPRMPEIYRETGILAFPTLADEWGLVVNEAMAAGLPVLGSEYSQAVEELVEDGRTGWRFHPDDPDACLGALERALGTPDDVLDEMRAACQERIAGLTLRTMADRMLAAAAARTPRS
jgi:glycosyltransferase involved in cell wall biosynthesis